MGLLLDLSARRALGWWDTVGADPLQRLSQVLREVKPISHLNCLRESLSCGISIGHPAITADDFDSRMSLHPRNHRRLLPVRQQIDQTVVFYVYQDGAIFLSFAQSKIVYSQHFRSRPFRNLECSDEPQKRIRTHG